MDDATWKVGSESADHITYIRRPAETTTEKDVDCNKTTTTPAPTTRRSSRSRLDVRSGVESGRRMTYNRVTAPPTPKMNYDGYDGDHLWQVSHRTDDHITYTRRGSSQGQGQTGELRRLGSGRDSVSIRLLPFIQNIQ